MNIFLVFRQMNITHAHFNSESFIEVHDLIDSNGGWIFGRDGDSYGKITLRYYD